MRKILRVMAEVYGFLPSSCKRQGAWVLGLMLVNGVLELSGVASVLPLMAAGVDPLATEKHPWLGEWQKSLGLSTEMFFGFLGVLFVLLFAFINLWSATTLWASCRFGHNVRHHLSSRLLEAYLGQPYVWLLSRNSAELTKDVLNEVDEVVANLVFQVVELLLSGFTVLLIAGALLVINPVVALSTVAVVGIVYFLVFSVYRHRSMSLGERRSELAAHRHRKVSESLSAVKEARVYSRRKAFLEEYKETSREYRGVLTAHRLVGELPKYVAETLAIFAIVGLMVYLTAVKQQNFFETIPMIALYIMATWRLVPAVQGVYHNVIKIRFFAPALEHIAFQLRSCWTTIDTQSRLPLESEIVLREVSFAYPGSARMVVDNISLRLPKNTSLALVGRSGEGKSTLADIIAGLLEPHQGRLEIDGRPLKGEEFRAWQQNVGAVPQSIFLTDDTIARNIALGVPVQEIDQGKLDQAAKVAHLESFLQQLPQGYATRLGERGITLSGGQQQRIGIARALYHQPEVLILDEATNALDSVTEQAVMQAIEGLAGSKTMVIIAHRLSTVRACDKICLIQDGRVKAEGTYQELMESSAEFRQLAREELKDDS